MPTAPKNHHAAMTKEAKDGMCGILRINPQRTAPVTRDDECRGKNAAGAAGFDG